MEKNMTLSASNGFTISMMQNVRQIVNVAMRPVEWYREYCSVIAKRELSTRQTLHLINAEVAFVLGALPVDGPLLLRALCCLWFVKAVLTCRKELAKNDKEIA